MSDRTTNEDQRAPKTKRRPKQWRRLAFGLLALLVLVALGGSLVIQNRLTIASWGFREAIGTLGLTDIDAHVSALDFDRVVLDDVRIGTSGTRLKRLELTYSFFDLPRGRVRRVTLVQPEITAVLNRDDRITTDFDGLFANGATENRDGAPPIDFLQCLGIEDGRLRLLSPAGDLLAEALLSLDAEVLPVERGATALLLHTGSVHLKMAENATIKGVRLKTPLDLHLLGPGRLVFHIADATLAMADVRAVLDGPLEVGTSLGEVRAGGLSLEITKPDSDGPFRAHLQTDLLEALDIQASALDLLVENAPDGPTAQITLQVDRLPGEKTARTPGGSPRPLGLTTTVGPSADGYEVSGTIKAGKEALLVTLKGEISGGASRGRLDLFALPATFSPALTPADLHALAGEWLTLTSGQIALKGTIHWDGGGVTPNLQVMLQDVAGQIDAYTIKGVSTVLTLTQFAPLKSTVADAGIGLLDLGIPLTDGLARYRFDGNGHVSVDSLKFTFADGQARSSAPLIIPLSGGRMKGTLLLENLSLRALSDLIALDGLSASGLMTGNVPVILTADGTILIDQASLRSVGQGEIHYTASGAAASAVGGSDQASVNLLMRAVENFHFETFNVTLHGDLRRNLTLGVSLKGSNPTLYDGYPIELEANVGGAFLDLITKNVHTYQISDRIRENLNEFLKALPKQASPAKQ